MAANLGEETWHYLGGLGKFWIELQPVLPRSEKHELKDLAQLYENDNSDNNDKSNANNHDNNENINDSNDNSNAPIVAFLVQACSRRAREPAGIS